MLLYNESTVPLWMSASVALCILIFLFKKRYNEIWILFGKIFNIVHFAYFIIGGDLNAGLDINELWWHSG